MGVMAQLLTGQRHRMFTVIRRYLGDLRTPM
jgi:hypothetical protein